MVNVQIRNGIRSTGYLIKWANVSMFGRLGCVLNGIEFFRSLLMMKKASKQPDMTTLISDLWLIVHMTESGRIRLFCQVLSYPILIGELTWLRDLT